MNTIGKALRLTVFGSSHGPAVGCVVDGCPPGLPVSEEGIQKELDLRRPAEGIGSERREEDRAEILSGLLNGRTTGAPIAILIRNKDKDSSRYETFRRIPRPSHADFPAMMKYGKDHDIRGGGQFSGRMTAPIVAGGAIAKLMLERIGVQVMAYTRAIGTVVDKIPRLPGDLESARGNAIRAATSSLAESMRREILAAKEGGDSVGGVIRCIATGLPVGVGEPFFDTLEGELAKMVFAIPAVRGVEFGAGFRAARMRGSEHNDPYAVRDGKVVTLTNNAGGVVGGLSNGMPVEFDVAFKPTASISREQQSVDLVTMEPATLRVQGRHDPCVVPRAVVVVEAAAALVLADLCARGGFLVG